MAALSPKPSVPVQDWAAHPCNGRMALIQVGNRPIGMVNLELFTTKARAWIKEDLYNSQRRWSGNVCQHPGHAPSGETAELARQMENTGLVDLFELNVSCPMPSSTVGMHIGKSPELTYQQIKAVKRSKLPVSVKLTPVVADMTEIAQAAESGGGCHHHQQFSPLLCRRKH